MNIQKLIILFTPSLLKRFAFICAFICALQGFSQSTPSVQSKVDTTFIKIGEQINYIITVETDSTDLVFFPEGQTFSPLETVEAFATDTTRKKNRLRLQKKYALTQFDSGVYTIPRQRIAINEKPFFTDSVQINVATVPVDTLTQKMYDIKSLIAVEKSNSWLWKIIAAIIIGLLLLAFLLYWFLLRKKELTEKEKEALLPAYDRALLELKRLENSRYLIQDEYKRYYSELTDIVRSYLEEDVHVSALESTTDQLIDKLEILKDAGELKLEDDTIKQFKRILQTADLVKFAKSKPATTIAEEDRKSVEQIVIKTKEALPEPTEEELLQQEEYLEELARKKYRKRVFLAAGIGFGVILISIASTVAYFGYDYVKDTVIGHPTKELLEGEWVSSSYGYPALNIETPKVLTRKNIRALVDSTAQDDGAISSRDMFVYGSMLDRFYVAVNTVEVEEAMKQLALSGAFGEEKPSEDELTRKFLTYISEQSIKTIEKQGAKNLIVKNDAYAIEGAEGLKVYGKFVAESKLTGEKLNYNYQLYFFVEKKACHTLVLMYQDDDKYAEPIIDRIVQSVKFKTDA